MASNILPIAFGDPPRVRAVRRNALRSIHTSLETLRDLYHVGEDESTQAIEFVLGEEDFVVVYPHGWKLVLIILSGMIPYMVVRLRPCTEVLPSFLD
jgi:hypothetical protein